MLRKSKILSLLLCFSLLFEQTGFAQIAGELDISGHIAAFRNSFIQDKFRPLHLRSLGYDNLQNNFRLLLDKGDLKNPKKPELETTTKTLLNYFFIGISLPNDTFWVNLRPDSENNIIDPDLAATDVGKVLLEADLQLKKDTASFTSPETPEGKEYWKKLYQKAGELLGNENITIPTLTRPWIVPGEIIIRETKDNAYIYKATLKVMLEQDYLKDSATYNFADPRLKTLNEYSSQLIRDLIIPKLTKEINTSSRYAPLRQIYYSLILAQWFKARFYGKGGLYSWLINRRNLQGLTSKTSWSKTTYFQAYQKSFKDGEYNIKEPVSTPYGQTIRSYFSGGFVCNVPIPAVPLPGVATNKVDGPTDVTVILGDTVASPLTKNDLGALGSGGDLNDLSIGNVKMTEEASSPSGLPAGGLQSDASSVAPTVTSSEQSQTTVNQARQLELGLKGASAASPVSASLAIEVLERREKELPPMIEEIKRMSNTIKEVRNKLKKLETVTDSDELVKELVMLIQYLDILPQGNETEEKYRKLSNELREMSEYIDSNRDYQIETKKGLEIKKDKFWHRLFKEENLKKEIEDITRLIERQSKLLTLYRSLEEETRSNLWNLGHEIRSTVSSFIVTGFLSKFSENYRDLLVRFEQSPDVSKTTQRFFELEKKLEIYRKLLDNLAKKDPHFTYGGYTINKGNDEIRIQNIIGDKRDRLINSIIKQISWASELNLTKQDIEFFGSRIVKDLLMSASDSGLSVTLGRALLNLAKIDSGLRVEFAPLIIMNCWREPGTSGEMPFIGQAGLSNDSALFKFINALTKEDIEQLKKKNIPGLIEFITAIRDNPSGIGSYFDNPSFVLFEKKFVTNGYLSFWHENPEVAYRYYKEDHSYDRKRLSDYLRAYKFKNKEIEEERILNGNPQNNEDLTVKEAIEKTLKELGLKPDAIRDEWLPNPEYQRLHPELKKMALAMLEGKDASKQVFAMGYFKHWENVLNLEDSYLAMKGILEGSSNEALKKSIISILEHKIRYGDKDGLSAILKTFNPEIALYSDQIKTALSALGESTFLTLPLLFGTLNSVLIKTKGNLLEAIKSQPKLTDGFLAYLNNNYEIFTKNMEAILKTFNPEIALYSDQIKTALSALELNYGKNIQILEYIIDYVAGLNSFKNKFGEALISLLDEQGERLNKTVEFINAEKNDIDGIFQYLQQNNITLPQSFIENFLAKRDISFLDMLSPVKDDNIFSSNPEIASMFGKILNARKKYETIKEAVNHLVETGIIVKRASLSYEDFNKGISNILNDYLKGNIGDKRLLSGLKNISQQVKAAAFKKIINRDLSEGEKEFLDDPIVDLYIGNLVGLYFRIVNSYPKVCKRIVISLDNLLKFKNMEKFHGWLFKESEWNKEIYQELRHNGYSSLLWDQGIRETLPVGGIGENIEEKMKMQTEQLIELASKHTLEIDSQYKEKGISSYAQAQEFAEKYFLTNDSLNQEVKDLVKDILESTKKYEEEYKNKIISSKKVTVEIVKDFLKDTYSGVGVPGCFAPHGSNNQMPMIHALETNALFLRVYDANNKMIANAVLVLTPQGVVVQPLYNATNLDLSRVVFEGLAALLLKDMVPSVLFIGIFQQVIKDATEYTRQENISAKKKDTLETDLYFDFSSGNSDTETMFTMTHKLTKEDLLTRGFKPSYKETEETKESTATIDKPLSREEKTSIRQEIFALKELNKLELNPILKNLEKIIFEWDINKIEEVISSLTTRSLPKRAISEEEKEILRNKLLEYKNKFQSNRLGGQDNNSAEQPAVASSAVEKAKEYTEQFIGRLGVPDAIFGGVKKLNNPKARAEIIDNKIYINSLWIDKMSEDEIERVIAHEVQHTRTDFSRDEKGLKIGGLHNLKAFQELQQRIGDLYDKTIQEKGNVFTKPRHQYQENWEVLSLLRGYEVYREQIERGLQVTTQPYEFIEAFTPKDLAFLNEDYLFEITKDFEPEVGQGTKISYEDLGYPEKEPITKSDTKSVTSSAIADKGGVDFRVLPIVNQPINTAMLKLSAADLTRLNNVNLDSEWAQIQNMVNAGIIPSNERIKEYVLASCLRQALGKEMDKVLGCIADIMRIEEDRVLDADAELKDMLVLI
ncbi:MAG: hypothetical protein ISS89_03190, partial [Candidatus Omnitrophica bacterium]|nr:hypothetical protein [Candidatus Omnitrophota bacterium]